MTIGERIREARKKANMSQEDLAKAIGVSSYTLISQYERGIRNPKSGTIINIAEALGDKSLMWDYFFDNLSFDPSFDPSFIEKMTKQSFHEDVDLILEQKCEEEKKDYPKNFPALVKAGGALFYADIHALEDALQDADLSELRQIIDFAQFLKFRRDKESDNK